MKKRSSVLIVLFVIVILFQSVLAQKPEDTKIDPKPKARLYDELPNSSNSEDRSARIDQVIFELQENPNSKAAVVFYCGKKCYYGEFEAHVRGIIKMKLEPRGIDLSRFVFIHGGYRNEGAIRIWIVPIGAGIPLPESTIKFEDVKFKGKSKYKIIAYECCDDF